MRFVPGFAVRQLVVAGRRLRPGGAGAVLPSFLRFCQVLPALGGCHLTGSHQNSSAPLSTKDSIPEISQFHHNSCGDVDRSSVSEEVNLRKQNVHIRRVKFLESSHDAVMLGADAFIPLVRTGIEVGTRLEVVEISQNQFPHVPHVSHVPQVR